MAMELEQRIGRRLKLKDLHTLSAVCRAGSMSKAATQLAMSQAAVSKALLEMERSLGFAVLERSTSGVQPTAAGRVLLERSRAVFDELSEGLREIEAFADPQRGHVRLGTTEAMLGVVTHLASRLARTHPGITLDIVIGDTAGLLAQLRARELDLVLTRLLPSERSEDLGAQPLFDEVMAVLASQTHPVAKRRRLRLADLMDQRWTLSPPELPLGQLVARIFAAQGLPLPAANVMTVSIYLRLNLLHTGEFVTVLPRSIAAQPLVRTWIKLLPVELPAPPGTIALLKLKRRKPSGAAQTVWQITRDVVHASP
jgi:DNA-binding transcriptional LysR family regulator